ncbi:MAG: DUF2231 domain-containing protein [Vicinamibacterales bacterium]
MGELHPQVVHFTIALSIVGVLFRLVSLIGRPAFVSPAATTLIVLAAVAGVVSTQSGDAAHDVVEAAPGVREAMHEHEEWGERARNALLLLAAVDLAALALARSTKGRAAKIAASVVGLVALFCVFEAGEHGGALVYGYAGGVGTRTGDPKDVERLLLAGLYRQAMQDRQTGNAQGAAALLELAATRFPGDPETRLLAAESRLVDTGNPQAALDALAAIDIAPDAEALRVRRAMLQADAFLATGQRDAALAVLQPIAEAFPGQPQVQQRIDELRAR